MNNFQQRTVEDGPGFSFDVSRENALSLNLRKADLYFERNRESGKTREYLANGVYDPPVPPVAPD